MVTITISPVNDPPVAVDDAYSVAEDTTLNVAAPGVLGNDSDTDGDPLTAALLSNVSHGSLNLNSNGSFTYTPDTSFSGIDSFEYTSDDGSGNTDTATVIITVESANINIYIQSIDMSIYRSFWKWSQVQATILINDSYGNPVSGAMVTGDWSGAYNKAGVSTTTSSDGKVTFKSKWGSGIFTFTVTDVYKSNWIYDPSQNNETSDSINIP
jgi:VCBS repeat-containing protein